MGGLCIIQIKIADFIDQSDTTKMAQTKRDYYEILDVTTQATEADIKRAYRRLAMEHHPDRNPGDRVAEEKFKEAAEAYQVLSNPELRQRYDRFGHQGVSSGGTGEGFGGFGNFEDIFSAFTDIFGGGGRVASGEDIQISMELSFLEAAKGAQRDIRIQRHETCETCQGSGAKPGTQPVICKACQGHGQIAHRQGFFTIATDCPQCRGQGSTIPDKCPTCRGNTRVAKDATVSVTVPAGVDEGTRLRMPGYGEPAPSSRGNAGDLYILFRIAADPRFVRKGQDVYVQARLRFPQAVLGTTLLVPTLDGTETIDVRPGTQPMEEKTLKGQGIPHVRGRGRGNLIVQFVVEVPKNPGKELTALIEQLDAMLAPAEESSTNDPAKSTFGRLFRGKKKQ